MLGLMNSPSDCVDFYARPKSPTPDELLNLKNRRASVTYMSDGRKLIDGKVCEGKEPETMWSDLLINAVARHVDGNQGRKIDQCDKGTGSTAHIEPKIVIDLCKARQQYAIASDYQGSTIIVVTFLDVMPKESENTDDAEEDEDTKSSGKEKIVQVKRNLTKAMHQSSEK